MNKLARIAIHWSVGQYKPNALDLKDYHCMVDDIGRVFKGTHKPEDNLDCKDGNYAEHLGGGNTGSIGVSYLSMVGYKNPKNVGPCPITEKQLEAGFLLIARLCFKYDIKVNPDTVFTHYEFGKLHPNTSSAGKIDITFIPTHPEISANKVGDFIRGKVQYYLTKIINKEIDSKITFVN